MMHSVMRAFIGALLATFTFVGFTQTVQAERGDLDAAAASGEKAVSMGGEWREIAQATLQSIQEA